MHAVSGEFCNPAKLACALWQVVFEAVFGGVEKLHGQFGGPFNTLSLG